MTSILLHFSWIIIFFLIRLFFFILAVYITLTFSTLNFSFDLFSSWFFKLSVSFSFDLFSSWFSFVVTFIRSIIIIYSFFYISPYSKPTYFIWLTTFFVLSMLIVINISNFFFLILGWDGLGLVSFFLIVYYQNRSSISSGLFTILINRIGDCFFIISISLIILTYPYLWDRNQSSDYIIIFFIMLTFITKRAIYPFSSWLPLAIAAPTPISALVHSSTLVTAGLYLLIRFSFIIYYFSDLVTLLLVLSIFTSFYAGLNSIFETDIKKLIALSTLSHLGFICIAFSCGLLFLSFFHLLVHALFKSVLFISIGDIITNLFHSQDIRFLSSGYYFTTSSFYTILVSIINLLGLPTISGYFSKDLILETCNFRSSSYFIVSLVYFNIIFTYYYTYQLFYFSFRTLKHTPYVITHRSSITHTFILLLISILGVVFGSMWVRYVNFYIVHVSVPLVWKQLPYFINLFIFTYLYINLAIFKLNKQLPFYYFSNIMFLSCVIITFISNVFLYLSFYCCKSSEFGLYNNFVNKSTRFILNSIATSSSNLFSLNSLLIIFMSLFIIFIFIIILLCNINIMYNCYL